MLVYKFADEKATVVVKDTLRKERLTAIALAKSYFLVLRLF